MVNDVTVTLPMIVPGVVKIRTAGTFTVRAFLFYGYKGLTQNMIYCLGVVLWKTSLPLDKT